MYSSPVEEDPYFPYITYVHITGVKLPSGELLTEIFNGTNKSEPDINKISIITGTLCRQNPDYDADTEDMDVASIKRRKTHRLYTKGKSSQQFQKFKPSVHGNSQSDTSLNTCETIINNPDTCTSNSSEHSDTFEKKLCNSTQTYTEPVCDPLNITTEMEAQCDPFILTTEVDDVKKTESEICDVNTKNDDVSTEPEVHNNLYNVTTELSSDKHLQEQIAQSSADAPNALPNDLTSYEIFQHTTWTSSLIREMQSNDAYYKLIIDYLKSDKLSGGQKEARCKVE